MVPDRSPAMMELSSGTIITRISSRWIVGLIPVGSEATEVQHTGRLEFLQLEGAGAAGGGPQLVPRLDKIFGNDRVVFSAQGDQKGRGGEFKPESDGVLVDPFDGIDGDDISPAAGADLGIHDSLVAVLYVLGGHLVPIVELDPFPQVKEVGGRILYLPGSRQLRLRLHVVVDPHQVFIDQGSAALP